MSIPYFKSVKKLHKVLQLLPTPNLFYLPNFEQKLVGKHHDDIIGTGKFQPNQMELNSIWQIVEESSDIYDVPLKNMQYSIGVSEIDLRSSVQLIFDVFSQIIDVREMLCIEYCSFFIMKISNCCFDCYNRQKDYIIVLPHIVKLCEISESRDHYRWIKDTMLKLQESVQMENSGCHQVRLLLYYIFVLCRYIVD